MPAMSPRGGARDAENPYFFVRRFQDLVEAKPRTGLPIGHYAAVLGVSESRLTAHCRRLTGRSPLQIINTCVMRKQRKRCSRPSCRSAR
jgi:AraC-like DNA-binding protein